MALPPYNALFICTGNSARSILAEAILNHLGQGQFRAWSAGSHPKGTVHPLALQRLEKMHIPTSGLRSKGWEEFARPDSPALHFVFTVCDQAAGETCPVWPGQPMTAHWGMPDPAAVRGTVADQEKAFLDTAITIKRRLELLLALPMEALDRMALQSRLKDIGAQ